jgi:CRISPR/Cas system-associated exonuclease Cas4 (RecB family)
MRNLATLSDITPETTVSEVFDLEKAYMKTVAALGDDDRQGHFHPSANGSCGRRNVYEYIRANRMPMGETYARADALAKVQGSKTTTEKADAEPRKGMPHPDIVRERDTLDFGHAIHGMVEKRMEMVRAYYEARGFVFVVKAELKHDPLVDDLRLMYGIGGTTDALIEITNRKGVHQRGILEVKSMRSIYFEALTTEPKREHLSQAHLYNFRFDAPVGWIWYFNKDTSDRKVYPYVFSEALFSEVLDKYVAWKEHAIGGTLPDREEHPWMCPRCEYAWTVCRPEILNTVLVEPARKRAAVARGGFTKPTRPAVPKEALVRLRRKQP